MTVREFMEATYNPNDRHCVRHPIKCNDGFAISVQGGTEFHYCSPRTHTNTYDELELGFPSAEDELIAEYAENPDNLTSTVYGYVPLHVVEELIKKHGGINCTETFSFARQ